MIKQLIRDARCARGPCSAWRYFGVLFVDPAGASGVRNVRALCGQPGDDR